MREYAEKDVQETKIGGKWYRIMAVLRTYGLVRLIALWAQYAFSGPVWRLHRAFWGPGARKKGIGILAGITMLSLGATVWCRWCCVFSAPLVVATLLAVGIPVVGRACERRNLRRRLSRRMPLGSTSGTSADANTPSGNAPWEGAVGSEVREAVMATIDRDGYARYEGSQVFDNPATDAEAFVHTRNEISIVNLGGRIAVRKRHQNAEKFYRELAALERLSQEEFVPKILGVDFGRRVIYQTYLPGRTLRLVLAEHGARTLERSFANAPDAPPLGSAERFAETVASGKQHLHDCVGQEFIQQLYRNLRTMHRAGVAWCDIKYGNVIIDPETLTPRLVDFGPAHVSHRPNSLYFSALCDRDVEQFNYVFGTDHLTRASLLAGIEHFVRGSQTKWYAPVDFGRGVFAGRPWSINSGAGKWCYILRRHIPSLVGKRILDLGCNNGAIALQMLREGAAAAVGFEIDEQIAEQAEFVRRGFEWADRRLYDFQVIRRDMVEICNMELGRFDIAIALCSLYYLDTPDMCRVVRRVADIADLFLVQCNVDPRCHSGVIRQKAAPEFLAGILSENGFRILTVDAPKGYGRPLIVAQPRRLSNSS